MFQQLFCLNTTVLRQRRVSSVHLPLLRNPICAILAAHRPPAITTTPLRSFITLQSRGKRPRTGPLLARPQPSSPHHLFPPVFLTDTTATDGDGASRKANPHWGRTMKRRMGKRKHFHAVCLFASERKKLPSSKRRELQHGDGPTSADNASLVVVSDDPVLHTHMLNLLNPRQGVYSAEIGGSQGFQQFLYRNKPWRLVCVLHGFTSLVRTEEFVRQWQELYEKRLALLEVEWEAERQAEQARRVIQKMAERRGWVGSSESQTDLKQEQDSAQQLSKRESLTPRFLSLIDMLSQYNEEMETQWKRSGVAPVSLVCRFLHERYTHAFNKAMEQERQRAMQEQQDEDDDDGEFDEMHQQERVLRMLEGEDDDFGSGDRGGVRSRSGDDGGWEEESEVVEYDPEAPESFVQIVNRSVPEEVERYMYDDPIVRSTTAGGSVDELDELWLWEG